MLIKNQAITFEWFSVNGLKPLCTPECKTTCKMMLKITTEAQAILCNQRELD